MPIHRYEGTPTQHGPADLLYMALFATACSIVAIAAYRMWVKKNMPLTEQQKILQARWAKSI